MGKYETGISPQTKAVQDEVACPEPGCFARRYQHCATHGKNHKTRAQLAADVRFVIDAIVFLAPHEEVMIRRMREGKHR